MAWRRTIAATLVLLLTLTGCTVRRVEKVAAVPAMQPGSGEKIVGITTVKGDDVAFDGTGATLTPDGMLHGTVKMATYLLPVAQVQRFWVERKEISKARTIGLVAGLALVTAGIIGGIVNAESDKTTTPATTTTTTPAQSCPFVYSWDGERYVFDAEPYGGAIAKGIEKDDYSELGRLREQDGQYRLRMTNEVDETQMTDVAELWVVDHAAGLRVVPDIHGRLRTLGAPRELTAASDDRGNDLLPWLRTTDRLIWEPAATPDAAGSLASDIVLTFPKPKDAKQVKLVANAATGLWGSYMIKKMVELRGRDLGKFYFAMNHSASARKRLADWEAREELYALKVYVEEPTGWEVRGILPGTGPYISKDRILPLDVSRVPGETLRLRIHPPAGFWALNSFAVDYTEDRPVTLTKLKPVAARDLQGRDLLKTLAAVDGRYYAMPEIGDSADLAFAAPPRVDGQERTVLLHTRGYYKLHISGTGPPDTKTLEAFERVPGSAARFAAEQFGQWQVGQVGTH